MLCFLVMCLFYGVLVIFWVCFVDGLKFCEWGMVRDFIWDIMRKKGSFMENNNNDSITVGGKMGLILFRTKENNVLSKIWIDMSSATWKTVRPKPLFLFYNVFLLFCPFLYLLFAFPVFPFYFFLWLVT